MASPRTGIHQKLHETARVATHGIIVMDHYANTRLAFIDIGQPYNLLPEKHWSDLFDQLGLRTETIRKSFVSYNALIDLVFAQNLRFIAKVTCPIAAGLNKWGA